MSTTVSKKPVEAARGVNLAQLKEADAKKKAKPPKAELGTAGTNPPVKPPAPPKPAAEVKPPAPPKPPEVKDGLPSLDSLPEKKPEIKLPITISVEEKPEEKKPEVPDDFTGVLCAPALGDREGIGRGTKYRAKVFGHPVTKIIRWCWNDGFVKVEIKKALESILEIAPQDTTYGLQKSQLKSGGKSAALPELTDEQATQLRSYRMVGGAEK